MIGQSMTLTLGDLRSKLPSDFSGHNVGIWVDPPWREKDDGGKFVALSQIAKKLLKNWRNWRPGKEHFLFDLAWKVNGWLK